MQKAGGGMIKHKIFLEALAPNDSKDFYVPAGYFGPIKQYVGMNHYLYCRTSEDNAWTFSSDNAVKIVSEMQAKGYPARCEPPVIRTF